MQVEIARCIATYMGVGLNTCCGRPEVEVRVRKIEKAGADARACELGRIC